MISWFYLQGSTPTAELTPEEVADVTGLVRYVWREGHLVKLTGGDALVDKLFVDFRFFLGEWFLNTKLGFPWKEYVLVKNPNMQLLELLFRRAITRINGITSLESLSLTPRKNGTRTLDVSFGARYGTDYRIVAEQEPFDLTKSFGP